MIYSLDSPVVLPYYGSTISSIPRRKTSHKSKYKRFIEGKTNKYYSSFDIMKRGNWDMVLIENCPCENLKELERREGEYIRNNPCVNKYIAGRTQKEWREENREILIEKSRQRYFNNHESNLEKKKKRWETNKDELNKIRRKKIICQYCNILLSSGALHRHQKKSCKSKPVN